MTIIDKPKKVYITSEGQKDDPRIDFLNEILLVQPMEGRRFVAKLVAYTDTELIFLGAQGTRSIYRRDQIRSMILDDRRSKRFEGDYD